MCDCAEVILAGRPRCLREVDTSLFLSRQLGEAVLNSILTCGWLRRRHRIQFPVPTDHRPRVPGVVKRLQGALGEDFFLLTLDEVGLARTRTRILYVQTTPPCSLSSTTVQ